MSDNESVMIPAKAVEAAAKAAYDNEIDQHNTWEAEAETIREAYRKDVRRILEAAAPFIAAEGFARGYVAAIDEPAK